METKSEIFGVRDIGVWKTEEIKAEGSFWLVMQLNISLCSSKLKILCWIVFYKSIIPLSNLKRKVQTFWIWVRWLWTLWRRWDIGFFVAVPLRKKPNAEDKISDNKVEENSISPKPSLRRLIEELKVVSAGNRISKQTLNAVGILWLLGTTRMLWKQIKPKNFMLKAFCKWKILQGDVLRQNSTQNFWKKRIGKI